MYHYKDDYAVVFPNLPGCVYQSPDDEKLSFEEVVKEVAQLLKDYFEGEDLSNLPEPFTIKEAAEHIYEQDPDEPYYAVTIYEVEIDL